MGRFFEELRYGYTVYAIAVFLFAFIYLVSFVFVVTIPRDTVAVGVRDYLTGFFWALQYYGVPVMMFLGSFGVLYSFVRKQKGRTLALIGMIVPWVFVWGLSVWWPVPFT